MFQLTTLKTTVLKRLNDVNKVGVSDFILFIRKRTIHIFFHKCNACFFLSKQKLFGKCQNFVANLNTMILSAKLCQPLFSRQNCKVSFPSFLKKRDLLHPEVKKVKVKRSFTFCLPSIDEPRS